MFNYIAPLTQGSRQPHKPARVKYISHWLATLLFFLGFSSLALAAPVNLLSSTYSTATGTGISGKPTISNFTVPAGKNRMLFVVAQFERDHCDKSTDNCSNSNTGTTGDLSDNFAAETGSYTSNTVQVTAMVQGINSLSKKNALTIGGTPSGDLRFANIRGYVKNTTTGAEIANTSLYTIEAYFIAFNEAEINQILNGSASGAVTITLPNIANPKSVGDDAILTAYVFDNVQQNDRSIVRNSLVFQNSTTSFFGISGNYTLTPTSYDAGDMPTNNNDGFLVIGGSSIGYPSSTGGFNTLSGYSSIHTISTTTNSGYFDANLGNPTGEPDGMSTTVQFRNGLVSNYSLQSSASSGLQAMGGWAAAFTIAAYNPDSSDAPSTYGVATHNITGPRLGASVDSDLGTLTSTDATGDDANGSDDEDGITFAELSPNVASTITASVQNSAGYLNAWIDWNQDGDFVDSGEQILTDSSRSTGSHSIAITPPDAAKIGNTFARFRICDSVNQCNTITGDAASGEVEDYAISIVNKPPVITSNGGGNTAAFNIAENKSIITTVTATDANNDTVSYSISGGTDAGSMTINTSTGLLVFNNIPDYEHPADANKDNKYEVIVRASDVRGGYDEQTLTITITNDTDPTAATCSGYRATVYDPNTTLTNTFYYGWGEPFNVNPIGTFNYVEFANTTNWLSIDGMDWWYGGSITDGIGDDAGYVGTKLNDDDWDHSIELKRVMTAQEAGNYRFYLNIADNHIKIYKNGELIYAKQNAYSVAPFEIFPSYYLAAGDELMIVLIEEDIFNTRLSLEITPLFENPCNKPPVITSNGGGTTATINVPENQTGVTTVTATDPDADVLSFSVTGGADANKFSLNTTSGLLTFKVAPNFEVPTDADTNNSYEIQVTVYDGKGGTDVQDISVKVTNVNEPPIITSNGGGATATINMPENQTAITTVTATDPENDTVTFSITGGNDASLMTINSSTGVLTFKTAPNFEEPTDKDANNTYEVQVTASDGKGGTDIQALTINVTNVIEDSEVRVKVMLQGTYDYESGLMQANLQAAKLIPTTQPYSMNPFKYQGTESVSSTRLAQTTPATSTVVDWVLVELRDRNTPTKVIATKAGLLTRDGNIIDAATNNNGSNSNVLVFKNTDNVNFYVAVRHRNHLGVMTDTSLALGSPNSVSIDFSNPNTATKGGTGVRLSNDKVSLMWAGDANMNNNVIANGPNNDPGTMLGAILLSPGNTLFNTNYVLYGYSSNDIDMNGYTLISGPDNDVNIIIGNTLLNPANTSGQANHILQGGLPLQ